MLIRGCCWAYLRGPCLSRGFYRSVDCAGSAGDGDQGRRGLPVESSARKTRERPSPRERGSGRLSKPGTPRKIGAISVCLLSSGRDGGC